MSYILTWQPWIERERNAARLSAAGLGRGVKCLAPELGQVHYFGGFYVSVLDDVLFTFAAQILPAGEGIQS